MNDFPELNHDDQLDPVEDEWEQHEYLQERRLTSRCHEFDLLPSEL